MGNKPMILVVEDDAAVRSLMAVTLETRGYRYHLSQNGAEALIEATTHQPDVMLLDLGLPDMDGVDIIRKVRGWSTMPIIVISARSEDSDKVEALDAGADDYLTKPFSMDELVYRIEAILRRAGGKQNKPQNIYQLGSYTFDTQRQTLTRGETQTRLTTKESELLTLLCMHVGDILQREVALKSIWVEDNYFNARSMDVYITKLRKLLKDDDRIQINNVHGKGYRLILPPSCSK